jgi:hypothetical protein
MPSYTYLDESTGEQWTDFRPMSQRDIGVGGTVIRVLSAPTIFPSDAGKQQAKKTEQFRRDILGPMVKAQTGSEMKSKM